MAGARKDGSSAFSPTRTHATRKPRMMRSALAFFQGRGNTALLDLDWQSPVGGEENMGQSVMGVQPIQIQPVDEDHRYSYEILGGYNSNAIRVEFGTIDRQAHDLDWLVLLSFTGCQVAFLKSERSDHIFALADEDAYVYCDKDPCEECVFKCKNGFVLYLHCMRHGVFGLPLSPRGKAKRYVHA